MSAPPPVVVPRSQRGRDHVWVASSYFAEGFPYTIVNNLAELLFASLGASLGAVGLTSVFHLPWNLKFLWAPLVDQFETKRRWLLAVEALLSVVLVLLGLMAESASMLAIIALLFLLLAVLSATHDIAIDGFYLESLDETGQSRFVGLRQLSYKLANLLVRGPAVVVAGVIGWRMGFIALGLMMAGILLVHAWVLPRHEVHKRPIPLLGRQLTRPSAVAPFVVVALALACEHRFGWFRRNVLDLAPVRAVPREGWIGVGLLLSLCAIALVGRRLRPGSSPYLAAFSEFLAQPRSALILAFVISFRTGESFLQKMKWPFFRDCIQLSLESYGVASGTFGVIASFTGTLVGGFLIARYGLRRWIWPFVIAQNGLHLLYVLLAVWGSTGRVDFVTVTAIISIEHLGEGLGTAVFTVFLMRCCDPRHKAAHMAIVTAIMSIGFTVAGMVSGYLAQALGFVRYFFFTFVVTIPSMAMIFFLPYLDGRPKREQG